MIKHKYILCVNCKEKFPRKEIKKVGTIDLCTNCYGTLHEFNPLDIIREIIQTLFSPFFSQTEIPEILFNPSNKIVRDDIVAEFIATVSKEEIRNRILSFFKNLEESPIDDKILLYMGLFDKEKGIYNKELEKNKEYIFGKEAQHITIDEKYFIERVFENLERINQKNQFKKKRKIRN